jgi:hypothetical protein
MKTQSAIKRALLACAAGGILSAASLVQAGVLATTGYIGEAVTINYNGSNQSTSAIAFTGATFDGNPIDPFWCVDITKHVPYPGWSISGYTAAIFQSSPLTFSAAQVQDLRTLFERHLPSSLTAQSAAAFQLAIWDLLFDDASHDLSTSGAGGFGVTAGNAGTIGLAQGWINDTLANAGSSTFLLIQLTSRANQDFVTPGTGGGDVPEPAGIPLLGIGLLAMVLLGRRRATATRR